MDAEKKMNQKIVGVSIVLAAALMWAVEPVVAKLAFQQQSGVLLTSTIRAVGVSIVAILYLLIRRPKTMKVKPSDFTVLAYIALVGTVFADGLYLYSLTMIPVVNAVILGHMQPLFVLLFGIILVTSDTLNKNDYFGIILLMIAAVFVTTQTLENALLLRFGSIGDILVLFATVAWASTAVAMRKYLTGLHAGLITLYRFGIAGLVFGGLMIFTNDGMFSFYSLIVGFVVGIGTVLYYEGLKRLKAAQVSALELTAPFFAAVIGFMVLGETVTMFQFIGMILVLIGVWFISRHEPIHQKRLIQANETRKNLQ
jgi:drug/metabolite transporter (DMT)-like permease